MNLSVSVESAFDYGSADYRALFERCGSPPFAHPLWIGTAAEIFPASRRTMQPTVTVRDDEGTLRLVLPLAERGPRPMRLVQFAHFGISDYTDPLATPEDLAAFAADDALVTRIRGALKGSALLRLPRVSASADLVARLLSATGSRPAPYAAHAIALPGSDAEWRSSIGRKMRQNLARRRRNAEGDGPLVFARATLDELRPALEALHAYRRARFPADEDAMQMEDGLAFYRLVAERGLPVDFVRLYTLHHGERLVALDYCIRSPGSTAVLLRGLHPEAETKHSYGMLMLENLIAEGIAAGDRALDLTVGDEAYKTEIGAHASPITIVERPGNLLGSAVALASRSDALRRALRSAARVGRTTAAGRSRRAPGRTPILSPLPSGLEAGSKPT